MANVTQVPTQKMEANGSFRSTRTFALRFRRMRSFKTETEVKKRKKGERREVEVDEKEHDVEKEYEKPRSEALAWFPRTGGCIHVVDAMLWLVTGSGKAHS